VLLANEIALRGNTKLPIRFDSDLGLEIIARIMRLCMVSQQAARVRLARLMVLSGDEAS